MKHVLPTRCWMKMFDRFAGLNTYESIVEKESDLI